MPPPADAEFPEILTLRSVADPPVTQIAPPPPKVALALLPIKVELAIASVPELNTRAPQPLFTDRLKEKVEFRMRWFVPPAKLIPPPKPPEVGVSLLFI